MITIVDYGLGNIGSIVNMLRHVGIDSRITSAPEEILSADKIILPGVGAFKRGMENLSGGLRQSLDEAVLVKGVPVLGLCLGMHLMTRKGEEGDCEGLGWVAADTVRFDHAALKGKPLKVPHMGWNEVVPERYEILFTEGCDEQRFYFAHSFHVVCEDQALVLASCDYGYEFTSVFRKNNIFGVQFHPEKSHRFGMVLLTNFAEYRP